MRIIRSLEFQIGSKEEKLPYGTPDFPLRLIFRTLRHGQNWIFTVSLSCRGTGITLLNCSIWKAAN